MTIWSAMEDGSKFDTFSSTRQRNDECRRRLRDDERRQKIISNPFFGLESRIIWGILAVLRIVAELDNITWADEERIFCNLISSFNDDLTICWITFCSLFPAFCCWICYSIIIFSSFQFVFCLFVQRKFPSQLLLARSY